MKKTIVNDILLKIMMVKNDIDTAYLQKEFKMKGILMHPTKYQEMEAETTPSFIAAFKPHRRIHGLNIILSPDMDENEIYIVIDYTKSFDQLRQEMQR